MVSPPEGRFSASFSLAVYVSFAYKLDPFDFKAMSAQLPKWANDDYAIDAKADGNPTKDQMRLMMQSLLADRFKLVVHFETREVPVFALTLVKAGQPGPKLIPHANGPPCPDEYNPLPPFAPPNLKDVFPPNCGETGMHSTADNIWFVGSRDTTMESTAKEVFGYGSLAGELDRAVVDRTGLKGRFDWSLEYKLDPSHSAFKTQPVAPNSDPGGTPFLDALRKQLGLKLVKTQGPVRTIVIDHVEKPSDN